MIKWRDVMHTITRRGARPAVTTSTAPSPIQDDEDARVARMRAEGQRWLSERMQRDGCYFPADQSGLTMHSLEAWSQRTYGARLSVDGDRYEGAHRGRR